MGTGGVVGLLILTVWTAIAGSRNGEGGLSLGVLIGLVIWITVRAIGESGISSSKAMGADFLHLQQNKAFAIHQTFSFALVQRLALGGVTGIKIARCYRCHKATKFFLYTTNFIIIRNYRAINIFYK